MTHSPDLVRALRPDTELIELVKHDGVSSVPGQRDHGAFDGPRWSWPKR